MRARIFEALGHVLLESAYGVTAGRVALSVCAFEGERGERGAVVSIAWSMVVVRISEQRLSEHRMVFIGRARSPRQGVYQRLQVHCTCFVSSW